MLQEKCSAVLTTSIYRTLVNETRNEKQLKALVQRFIQEQQKLKRLQKVHYKLFFTKRQSSISDLSTYFSAAIYNLEIGSLGASTASKSTEGKHYSKEQREWVQELYSNRNLDQNQIIQEGELVYVDTKLKMTNSNLKSLAGVVKRRLINSIQASNFESLDSEIVK